MKDARATNTTTHFFRELRALEMIRDLVAIPNKAAGRSTVVWSVGCSTGDEPYGLAMLCRQAGCAIEILATDVNPSALERAERGRYRARNLRHVDGAMRNRWFEATGDHHDVIPAVREDVHFRRHDITKDGAPRHDVDVALCRNVMVYFNAQEIQRALATIVASLRPGALFILGASEWLRADLRIRGTTRLVAMEKAGVIVYQRVDGSPAIAPPAAEPARARPPVTIPAGVPGSDAVRVVDQLRGLGDMRLDAGKPAEARACYAKALEQAPLLADLHLRTALSHLHAEEPALALESLRRALFLTPELWQAWVLMADLAHDSAQARRYLDQARTLLESAAVHNPPELRAFGGDHHVALAAVRHRLRSMS